MGIYMCVTTSKGVNNNNNKIIIIAKINNALYISLVTIHKDIGQSVCSQKHCQFRDQSMRNNKMPQTKEFWNLLQGNFSRLDLAI